MLEERGAVTVGERSLSVEIRISIPPVKRRILTIKVLDEDYKFCRRKDNDHMSRLEKIKHNLIATITESLMVFYRPIPCKDGKGNTSGRPGV